MNIFKKVFVLVSIYSIALSLLNCSNGNEELGSDPSSTSGSDQNYYQPIGSDLNYYQGAENISDFYPGTEEFGDLTYNGFVTTEDDNLSTFAIDVDNGSYTFGRKRINSGSLPPKESVRVEEYINYFKQDYTAPTDNPFSVSLEGAPSLFRGENLNILRVGIQGKEVSNSQRRPWNLTFLIDISGSMQSRLDLVKDSLYIIVDNMHIDDKISICTYAGSVGTVLYPTSLEDIDKDGIKGIISDLTSGGGTAMSSGIQNAYNINMSGLIDDGINRIVVCSDGDANIGIVSHEEILDLISSYIERGITLSTIGFGQGNYKDYMMEQLADNGNGNYYYIDTINEAERLFAEELTSVMEVIAKDVKVQVEFNTNEVKKYRLIGYENRDISDDDFNDASTDAGELGAGHRVTALYELELKSNSSGNLGTVHLRYKLPQGDEDIPMDVEIKHEYIKDNFYSASNRFQFTVGAAEFAEILRESPHIDTSLAEVEELVESAIHNNGDEWDFELLGLIRKAIAIGK